jgi:hypothetical protein
MGIFRPWKKWLIPVIAACIGFAIGFQLFPSKQEHLYQQWLTNLDHLSNKQYKIETYHQKDGKRVASSEGVWSRKRSNYQVSSPVSNGSYFSFAVHFEGNYFYIHSGNMWRQGESPHRIVEELSPLDHPFQWSKLLLQEADQLQMNEDGNKVTYIAKFDDLSNFDFRGTLLKEQLQTNLIMVIENDELQSITFEAEPIKPKEIGLFTSYPEEIRYKMSFVSFDQDIPPVSKEALESEQIE